MPLWIPCISGIVIHRQPFVELDLASALWHMTYTSRVPFSARSRAKDVVPYSAFVTKSTAELAPKHGQGPRGTPQGPCRLSRTLACCSAHPPPRATQRTALSTRSCLPPGVYAAPTGQCLGTLLGCEPRALFSPKKGACRVPRAEIRTYFIFYVFHICPPCGTCADCPPSRNREATHRATATHAAVACGSP